MSAIVNTVIINRSQIIADLCDQQTTLDSNPVHIQLYNINCYQIQKTASCTQAFTGAEITFCSRITYTCDADSRFTMFLFRDVLDPRFTYVPGSFRVNGQPRDPVIANNTVEYQMNDASWQGAEANICFKVIVN